MYTDHQDQTAAYTGVIPIMLNKIDANEAPSINGDGTQAYDFIDVEDVARCNICALESEAKDEFYNVGTGVQTSIKELCDTILDLKQSDLKVSYNPYSEDDARRLVQNRIGCPKRRRPNSVSPISMILYRLAAPNRLAGIKRSRFSLKLLLHGNKPDARLNTNVSR